MEEPLIHKQQKLNKREQANCFSRLFFWYVFPTIKVSNHLFVESLKRNFASGYGR